MEILITIIFGFLIWSSRSEIRQLRTKLEAVKLQLQQVLSLLEKQGITLPDDVKPAAQPHWQPPQAQAPTPQQPPRPQAAAPKAAAPAAKKERIGFEQQFGARLPVWIGGIALALAGFYMVKYSIETGLLSPGVRVVLGLLFGAGLLGVATWIRTKPGFANGVRISQALSGAGIADLYICIFAATSLYTLIPPALGFAGMAVVTAIAVVLSLRHGMPIALLGLVGGFLTPAMVGSNEPNAPLLFIYLYFVLAGLMAVIRTQRWWIIALPTVVAAFLWVLAWMFSGNFTPADSLYLGLFIMAVSATVVAASRRDYAQEMENGTASNVLNSTAALNYIALAGAVLLMGLVTSQAGFGFLQWGLFGLLSLGGIGLAFFNQKLYGLVPWLSMAVNAVMLIAWNTGDIHAYALTVSLFAALYIISGYVLQSCSERPLIWSGLVAASSLGYYLIAYYALHDTFTVSFIPLFWGVIAVEFAGLGSLALKQLYRDIPPTHPQKQHVLAIYAATVTAFISIGLTIELPREFLSVAFAAQLLAICWINTKLDVKALRPIAAILACAFGFLLIPQLLLLVQLTAYSLVEAKLTLQKSVPLVDWPLFQLGLPALFFAGGSILLRKQRDDMLVRVFEIAAVALIGVMGYYLTRHAFHLEENVLFVKAGFLERGVITNILFLYGLACFWVARRYARPAVSHCALVLTGIAAFRILYFDMVMYNPLWSPQDVGETPIVNTLLLVYGLPILWAFKATQELPAAGKPQWSAYGYGFILLLAFVLVSLNVRQLFHGRYLHLAGATNAETYAYSAVWLLFGIGLLFLGTLRKDKMIRVASLIIMLFTVGKVFLYDAGELEGLFRVFSFFGLGLSLLGLSWFYTRFVFTRKEP